jgi:hypothetical protein
LVVVKATASRRFYVGTITIAESLELGYCSGSDGWGESEFAIKPLACRNEAA